MQFENTIIRSLITSFYIIIPLGCVARMIYCGISTMHDEERKPETIRRIKNVLFFLIFAICAIGIIHLTYHYYG